MVSEPAYLRVEVIPGLMTPTCFPEEKALNATSSIGSWLKPAGELLFIGWRHLAGPSLLRWPRPWPRPRWPWARTCVDEQLGP